MSTMNAARNPSSSWIPCWMGGDSASPLNSAVTPAGSTVSRTAFSTATTRERSAVSIVSENCASAYAIRPLSENVWSENGLPTLSMPGLPSVGLNSAVLSFAIAALTAALRSGVSRRSPFGAAKTRFSTEPCSDENSALIRSVAFWVSEPGISNLSLRLPPIGEHEDEQECDRSERAENDPPGVRRTCPRPAREQARREPFVRQEPSGLILRCGVVFCHSSSPRP